MNQFISLMYHNVCARQSPDGSWPGFPDLSRSVTGYFVDRDTFAKHCSLLSETSRPVDSAGGHSESLPVSDSDRRPSVQITFDDGWRGTFDEAGPLLEAHGLNAVLFVTTDLIGHPYFADRHQLAVSSPTFSIGAHGRSHRLLADLSDDEVHEELAVSKATLEDILSREVDQLAFPGGSFDERVIRIAREIGYRQLYTSEVRVNGKSSTGHLIGRVPIKSGINDESMRRYIAGNVRSERLRGFVLKTAKRFVGPRGYASIRSRLLSDTGDQVEMTDLSSRHQMKRQYA